MISVDRATRYCCEDLSKIQNYQEAANDLENVWDCHHRLGIVISQKQLKKMGLYKKRPAIELIFVRHDEHLKLHAHFQNGVKNKFYGHRHTEENKIKWSVTKTNDPKLSKQVYQYTLDGRFVTTYPSCAEAQRQTGVDAGSISHCCLGYVCKAGNFFWSYQPN